MAITTTIAYGREFTTAEHTTVNDQIAILVTQGVTDGTYWTPEGTTIGGPVIRTWTTVDSANNWVTFNQTAIAPPPVTATVSQ